MSIQTLFVDVDGTLLTSELVLTERVRHAVNECVAAGIAVILSSGRSLKSLRGLAKNFEHEPTFIIASNGGIVADEVHREAWVTGVLESWAIEHIVRTAADHKLGLCAYTREGSVSTGDAAWVALEIERSGATPDTHCELAELSDVIGQEACKILLIGAPEVVTTLRPQLSKVLGQHGVVYTTYPDFLEVAAPGATKVHAIQDVIARLGVEPKDILAVGDGENDLPMLEMAGLAVAVRNATAEVRRAADVIVPSNDEDGVAIAIDALIFSRPEALSRVQRVYPP